MNMIGVPAHCAHTTLTSTSTRSTRTWTVNSAPPQSAKPAPSSWNAGRKPTPRTNTRRSVCGVVNTGPRSESSGEPRNHPPAPTRCGPSNRAVPRAAHQRHRRRGEPIDTACEAAYQDWLANKRRYNQHRRQQRRQETA